MSWVTQADWKKPLLNVSEVAKLLDVQPNTVTQLVARGVLPQSVERVGRRNAWPPAEIYPYALANTPGVWARIPRLFPRVPAPSPAKFLGAQKMPLLGDGPTFVVYEWLPGDGASGSVRLAYPIGNEQGRRGRAEQAQALYAEFSEGAVAVPSAEDLSDYPSVYVADATTSEVGREYRWSYLAGLLRIDVPWWPRALRREEAMLAWRPGAPPRTVSPYFHDRDADALTDLIDSSATELTADALARRAADVKLRQLTGDYRYGGSPVYPDTLGFVGAALHDIDMTADYSGAWTWDAAAAALHHPVPSPSAAAAALAVVMTTEPVAVATVSVPPTETHPWAREWADRRLEAATGPRELGDHLVAQEAGRVPVKCWLRDPLNPDCWAVETVNGVVHATVGTRVPAEGPAKSVVLLGIDVAFFRDGSDTLWPLPHPDQGGLYSGFPGTGPGDFARAIVRIAADSSASVATGPEHDRDGRLWALISKQPPPLEIDVANLLRRT